MHLAGVTRGAMMKRQGEIRIGFIHQTTPIEQESHDNGKKEAVLKSRRSTSTLVKL